MILILTRKFGKHDPIWIQFGIEITLEAVCSLGTCLFIYAGMLAFRSDVFLARGYSWRFQQAHRIELQRARLQQPQGSRSPRGLGPTFAKEWLDFFWTRSWARHHRPSFTSLPGLNLPLPRFYDLAAACLRVLNNQLVACHASDCKRKSLAGNSQQTKLHRKYLVSATRCVLGSKSFEAKVLPEIFRYKRPNRLVHIVRWPFQRYNNRDTFCELIKQLSNETLAHRVSFAPAHCNLWWQTCPWVSSFLLYLVIER